MIIYNSKNGEKISFEDYSEVSVAMAYTDKLTIFFDGHAFEVEYDQDTNENLKITKVI